MIGHTGQAGSWRKLTAADEKARFSQIMRLMDERYSGLSEEGCERWVEAKIAAGKPPELWGWFRSASANPADIRQVFALTSRRSAHGYDLRRLIAMVGVAADVIPQHEWGDEQVLRWLGRAVLCLVENYGPDVDFQAMRPKTMTWPPIQRLHDYLRAGLIVRQTALSNDAWQATVVDERDRGDALHWIIRIEKCRELVPQLGNA